MNRPLLSYDEINNLSSLLSKKLESFLYQYSLDNQLSAVNLDGAIININIYPEDNDESELSNLLRDNDYASEEFDKMINYVLDETVLSDTVKKISQTIEYKADKIENSIIILVTKKDIGERGLVEELENIEDIHTIYDYEPSVDVEMVYDITPYGKLVMKIGEGSYGVVQLYENKKNNERYAVKFMSLFEYGGMQNAALREIAILSRCSHPFIVPLLGIYAKKKSYRVAIIMPRMKSDMRKYLIKTRNPRLYKLEKYAYQIITATAYLHSRDIIHRDLKPENILYDGVEDRMYITDFGISRALACPPNTDKTLAIITLWYSPPEILLGGSDYSYHVDIWSLGAILYEMLTRRPLFPGDNKMDTLYSTFRTLGTPDDDIWPGVSNYPEWKSSFPMWKRSDKIREDITKVTGDKTDAWTELIKRALIYQPSRRDTAFEMMNNPLFDAARKVSAPLRPEPGHFSCLDNLYLRRRSAKENRFDIAENVTSLMRAILLDWLIEVHRMFKLKTETFFLMQYILDEYLPLDIQRNDLEGFGLSCLNIAASYLQVSAPKTIDYRYVNNNNTYSSDWLNNKVKEILEGMKYDLVITTVSDFVKEYCESFYTPDISKLATTLLYSGIFLKNVFVFEEYEFALWAIYYACKYYQYQYKHESLLSEKDILQYPLKNPKSKAPVKLLEIDSGDDFESFLKKVNA